MIRVGNDNSGFTLMEILIAISLFGLVVSMAYGSYNATFRIIHSAGSQARLFEKGRVAMDLLVNDLQLVYQGSGGFLQGKEESLNGKRADTLDFTSTGHIRFERDELLSGYALIRYQVQASTDEAAGLALYRHDQIALPGQEEEKEKGVGLMVCDGLSEVRFVYSDQDGEVLDEWDSEERQGRQGKFPALVEITLHFIDPEDAEGEIVFRTGVAWSSRGAELRAQ